MLQLRDIAKSFRTDLVETKALSQVSFALGAGEFVAVTGPSGSGKTTLLNVLGLLEQFDSGSYEIDGHSVTLMSDADRSRLRNEKIGFIFQSFNLIPDLTIYDNVAVPLGYRRMSSIERRSRVTEALERVGLASRMRHLPAQLSGGQQQRAAIARALAGRPRVILADEPTGNLDSTMSLQIMEMLVEINRSGTSMVMVTHNLELARQAHRHVEMADGHLSGLGGEQGGSYGDAAPVSAVALSVG